ESPEAADQFERAKRLMNVEAPARGADEPLDRHPAAVRAELIAALAVTGWKRHASAIELRSAFAEPEDLRAADRERHGGIVAIERDRLDRAAGSRDDDRRRRPFEH